MALFLLCFSGLLSVFFLPTRLKPINMLKQIISYGGFHRIENKVDPFPTGKLCGGDKVTVAGDQNDLVYLLFIGKGSDI